jgi:RNA polymerase sigma-70 factor, ECF subfamily
MSLVASACASSVTEEPESTPSPSCAPSFVRPTLEELYRSARQWLPRELRRLGVASADVEDLLHDVVLRVHQALDGFDPMRHRDDADGAGALRAWILTIARRVAAKDREKAWHRAELGRVHAAEAALERVEPLGAEDLVLAADRRRLVQGVLDRLDPKRGEVVVLHDLSEMSAPDIARTLGLNENTVKSRLARGRGDARRAIERLSREDQSVLHDVDEPRSTE